LTDPHPRLGEISGDWCPTVLRHRSIAKIATVSEDGTFVPVIQPGPITDDGLRIIRSGRHGDPVVIDGLVRARPGSKVTPQRARSSRGAALAAARR
jgi:hypothetical protein